MNARSAHALPGLAAGAMLALGLRMTASALDDSALYMAATAAAIVLAACTWWFARRSGRAAPAPQSNAARGVAIAACGAGFAAALLLLDAVAPGAPPLLPGAARAQALATIDMPDARARVLASAWDGASHAAAFAFESPKNDTAAFGVLLRDGVPAAALALQDGAELAALCERGLPSLAYARPHARVLIAGDAGNLDLACARHFAPRSIDVIEPSAALRTLAARAPIAGRQDAGDTHVHWHAVHPRSFARAHAQRYELAVLHVPEPAHTWPAGVLPLRDATLETDAGLAALLDALVPDGALFATVHGEPAALRFVTTARAALLRLGVAHPELHFVVQQSGDAYGVLIKRAQFVLDEVLDLHQANRVRKPLAELPWFDALLHGAEQPPVLRSTPGAPFLNRFGQLLAPAPNAASVFAEHYLFDVSAPSDARPLFHETSRIDQPQSLNAHSAARVLPALALIALACGLLLTLFAGSSLAPTAPARLRATGAPLAIGCAQGLAYAWAQHALALWLVPSHAFATAALGAGIGAGLGFRASSAGVFARPRAQLLARALGLAAFAAIGSALEPALAHASVRGAAALTVLSIVGLLALGAALALPSATALSRANAPAPAWLAFAHAAGFAVALPLAAALVLFASYQALVIAVAALLALLVLAALRAPG